MFYKENILILNKDINDKKELFIEIANRATKLGISNNFKELVNGFIYREKQGTTGFIDTFGIPHCRNKYILKPSIIFIKSLKPIKWDSLDGSSLENMFALLVPETSEGANEHLNLLASISRKLMDEEFRNNIKKTKDLDELFLLINKVF